MLRANMILLALMGGGMALWASRPTAECREARARNAPNAAAICGQSGSWYGHGGGSGYSGGGYSGGGYWGGRMSASGTGGSSTTGIASVVRGGFGGFHGFGGS